MCLRRPHGWRWPRTAGWCELHAVPKQLWGDAASSAAPLVEAVLIRGIAAAAGAQLRLEGATDETLGDRRVLATAEGVLVREMGAPLGQAWTLRIHQ